MMCLSLLTIVYRFIKLRRKIVDVETDYHHMLNDQNNGSNEYALIAAFLFEMGNV